MAINFLQETLEALKHCDKTENDVLWVGNSNKCMTWEQFKEIANFKYYNGFGCNAINLDFVIVGQDWWLERYEYDGSESWEFQTLPLKPENNNLTLDDLICHTGSGAKCPDYSMYNKG